MDTSEQNCKQCYNPMASLNGLLDFFSSFIALLQSRKYKVDCKGKD